MASTKVLVKLRLPKRTTALYREIARTALLPVDTVISVVMAAYVVRHRMGAKRSRVK